MNENRSRGSVGGAPVDIVISMVWRSLTSIDPAQQTFTAEVEIKGTVHNAYLNDKLVISPDFVPDVVVINGVDTEVLAASMACYHPYLEP